MADTKGSVKSILANRRNITCCISYSRRDAKIYVQGLSDHLQLYGVRILLDENDISPGSQWVDALQDLIKQADVLKRRRPSGVARSVV